MGAEEILALSELRQHPVALEQVDGHTLRISPADVTYVPLPGGRTGMLAGLLSLTLPDTVRTGEVYRLTVHQYSGLTHKILGTFQVTVPVRADPEILPKELRKLSVLRYVQQSIPVGNRWHGIFGRYVDAIVDRVRALGGDPDAVEPSPDGGEEAKPGKPPKPTPGEICPPEGWCVPIPWSECDIEGELDLHIRFRRRWEDP